MLCAESPRMIPPNCPRTDPPHRKLMVNTASTATTNPGRANSADPGPGFWTWIALYAANDSAPSSSIGPCRRLSSYPTTPLLAM